MWSQVILVLKDSLTHFNDDDGWAMASHVALSTIMALFPFLIFATSMAGFLGNEDRAADIVRLVFDTWPDKIADPVASEVDAVLNQTHAGFLTLGIGLALFFASNGVEAIRTALNRAYRVNEHRSMFRCRMQSLLFVFLGSLVLLMVSLLLFFVPLVTTFAEGLLPILEQHETTIWLLRFGLAIGALTFALFACHAWLPAGKRPMATLWPGILATVFLWFVSASLFAMYLERFADYAATFAGLAGIMTAQIFLYLMSVIVILGGELNASILKFRQAKASVR